MLDDDKQFLKNRTVQLLADNCLAMSNVDSIKDFAKDLWVQFGGSEEGFKNCGLSRRTLIRELDAKADQNLAEFKEIAPLLAKAGKL